MCNRDIVKVWYNIIMLKRLASRFRPGRSEVAATREASRREEIVVFGSNLSGAMDLTEELDGFLGRVGLPQVEVTKVRHIDYIEDAFFGREPGENTRGSVPMGVILFPQMRFRDEYGQNHNVTTTERSPAGIFVTGLCAEYGVPLVTIRGEFRAGQESATAEHLASLIAAQMPRAIEQ